MNGVCSCQAISVYVDPLLPSNHSSQTPVRTNRIHVPCRYLLARAVFARRQV